MESIAKGICKICGEYVNGNEKYIELTNCKHLLYFLCIQKFYSQIAICLNDSCSAVLTEEDYSRLEIIRKADYLKCCMQQFDLEGLSNQIHFIR